LLITERIDNLWGQSYDRMLISFVYLETGRLGDGIKLAEESIQLADAAGLMAGSIWFRSELAWVYAYCGAFEKAYELIDQVVQVAEAKQPGWKTFPLAAKLRVHLLQGDVQSAMQLAGNTLFEPISIPYARYTIFLCMTNIELAVSQGNHELGLRLADDLLNEVTPLTRVDIPDVLRWKGKALIGLGQFRQAHHVLTEACARARQLNAYPQLWSILEGLSTVNSKLGNEDEAESNQKEARVIIQQIAESLQEVGLRESFLSQPWVQALFR
jgi:tetratricopeptide (TPR) repeat protein